MFGKDKEAGLGLPIGILKPLLPKLLGVVTSESFKEKIIGLLNSKANKVKTQDNEEVYCAIFPLPTDVVVRVMARNRDTGEERMIELYNYDELAEIISELAKKM